MFTDEIITMFIASTQRNGAENGIIFDKICYLILDLIVFKKVVKS